MRHILSYLPPEKAVSSLRSGQPFAAHYPNGKLTCSAGDIIYFVTVVRGARELFMIGRMEVGVVRQIRPHRQQLFARPPCAPLKAVNVTGSAPDLRFETVSNLDRLLLTDGRVNPLQLCAPRVLAGLTWAALEAHWAAAMALEARNHLLASAIELESQGEAAEEMFAELADGDAPCFPNQETIREVERHAVEIVTGYYEGDGFEVVSRESERVGFDLDCVKRAPRRAPLVEHAEVKGLSGGEFDFVVTAREVECAKTDPLFALWVVTHALGDYEVYKFSRREFLERFDLKPTEFRATLR
jgi:hypothetical protein